MAEDTTIPETPQEFILETPQDVIPGTQEDGGAVACATQAEDRGFTHL